MPSPTPLSRGPLDDPAPRAGLGWALALRAGDVTPWPAWRDSAAADAPAGAPGLPFLPGAQQLELLRRLNVAADGRPLPAGLADRVLRAGSTDRGRGDLPLAGGGAASPFGPPPVDPTDLPAEDLLKVAAGMIAEDLAARAARREPRDRRARWRAGPAYAGDPWAIEYARHDPRWARPPRREGPAYVLAGDLGTLAAHAWAGRALDGAGLDLHGWLRDRITADRLPPALDVVAHARAAAERYGVARTVIVTDPSLLPARDRPAPPPRVGVAAVELTRRVGRPLGLMVAGPERRRLLAHHLVPLLAARPGAAADPLTVPERWLPPLAAQADLMTRALTRAGYPVLGSLEQLVPTVAPTGSSREPEPAAALGLALDLLVDPKDGAW
ncbi:hypothetical protein [Nocardioides sp. YIM 152588]|uniref:hypothetical protein n=1 Tax=Nocardioides sp. YIM 152588 TaxID=3158259 RepID=UPI0032E45CE4